MAQPSWPAFLYYRWVRSIYILCYLRDPQLEQNVYRLQFGHLISAAEKV